MERQGQARDFLAQGRAAVLAAARPEPALLGCERASKRAFFADRGMGMGALTSVTAPRLVARMVLQCIW